MAKEATAASKNMYQKICHEKPQSALCLYTCDAGHGFLEFQLHLVQAGFCILHAGNLNCLKTAYSCSPIIYPFLYPAKNAADKTEIPWLLFVAWVF